MCEEGTADSARERHVVETRRRSSARQRRKLSGRGCRPPCVSLLVVRRSLSYKTFVSSIKPSDQGLLDSARGRPLDSFMSFQAQNDLSLDPAEHRSDSPTLGFWIAEQKADIDSVRDRDSFDSHPLPSPYSISKSSMSDRSRMPVLSNAPIALHDDWSSEHEQISPGVSPSSAYIVESPTVLPSPSVPSRMQNYLERSASEEDSFSSDSGLPQSPAKSPVVPSALPDPSQFPDPYPVTRAPRWQYGSTTPALSSADSSSVSTRSSAYTNSARSGDYGHVHVVTVDGEPRDGTGITSDDVVQLLARDAGTSSSLQGRTPYDQSRWSDLYANSIRSRSSSVGNSRNDSLPEAGFRALRTTPSFDMGWQTVDERDEVGLASEDEATDDDAGFDEDDQLDEEELPTSAMVIAEEGRGIIVRGDDVPIVRLEVKPGASALVIYH